jgi:hypothetical protein
MQQLLLREKKSFQGGVVLISDSRTKPTLQLQNYAESKLGERSIWSSGKEILTKLSEGKGITVKEAYQVLSLHQSTKAHPSPS